MGVRGPKSAEEQLGIVAGAIIPGRRPDPPSDLSLVERDLWVRISRSLPSEWFHTGDPATLLTAYVRTSVLCDACAAQIRAIWPHSPADASGWKQARTMMRMYGSLTDRLVSLAVRLKLTPSSRYRADATERATRGMGGTPPWSDW